MSKTTGVNWSYFDKFNSISDKYLPDMGEGNTKATQIVTAVSKLVYKWYNDGDVFDNTYYLSGWCNDLSSYANWLANNYPQAEDILNIINNVFDDNDYEQLLKSLADTMLQDDFLVQENKKEKVDSIYTEDGPFTFQEFDDDEEEDW